MTSVVLAGLLVLASPAEAQEVSARDRQAAAQAYDRGTAAYLAEQFDRAAEWFETAHRLAPASAALIQAVRSHGRAGNTARSATLALQLEALYADDRQAHATATEALRNASRFLRVDVDCSDCSLEVDGTLMGHSSFFVAEGSHRVVASFETGQSEQTVSGGAGETRALHFDAPLAAADPDPDATGEGTDPSAAPDPGDDQAVDDGMGVIPLWVSLIAVGATIAVGSVLIWSGVDTLDGVPAYEADPTAARLAEGQSREMRTNWLIGATSLVGAATALLLIFTDYDLDGGSAETTSALPTIDVQANGAVLGLRGRF